MIYFLFHIFSFFEGAKYFVSLLMKIWIFFFVQKSRFKFFLLDWANAFYILYAVAKRNKYYIFICNSKIMTFYSTLVSKKSGPKMTVAVFLSIFLDFFMIFFLPFFFVFSPYYFIFFIF